MKFISFGYDHRGAPATATRTYDARDVSHDTGAASYRELLERIKREALSDDVVAIGCKKGKHRSVSLAQSLSDALGGTVEHLDVRSVDLKPAKLSSTKKLY